MMKRKLLITLILIFAATAGGGLWWVESTRAKAESEILKAISPDQIVEILQNQQLSDPAKTRAIVETLESRQLFIKGMREYLGLAARARREGQAEDANFKINFENKTKSLIASLYAVKLDSENKEQLITSQAQIGEFWSDISNEQQFKVEMDALAAVQRAAAEEMESELGIEPPLSGERLQRARTQWAKSKIISEVARADHEFMQLPLIKLRTKILEAGILSSNYLAKNWKKNIKASETDIKKYLAEHPEYDLSAKRVLAERLLQRAIDGEDLSKLAKEFSEDRGSRDQGGLYSDFSQGGLWPEIENAVRNMKRGQIADHLIESKDGYHILQLVDTSGKGTDTKLTIRHILIQKRFEDPSSARVVASAPPPFKTPIEIAKGEIEKAKRQAFIDGIIAAEKIEMPDDFEFETTPAASGE